MNKTVTDFNKIVKEWAYRVHDGKPNPNNSTHLYHLSEILIEYKWPLSVIDELLYNLSEAKADVVGKTLKLAKAKAKDGQTYSSKKSKKVYTKGQEEVDGKEKPKPKEKERNETQQRITNSLNNGSLDDVTVYHDETQVKREKGDGGAGGAIASEGESKFTSANNQMSTKDESGKSEHDKFKEENKKTIEKRKKDFKSGKINDKMRPHAEDKRTLKQLGFKEPYSDEAFQYLAEREVWSEKQLEHIKKDKKSVFYKGGSAGFGKKDEAYLAWMRASYDGAISTQAHLENSRLDTTKPHTVVQSTTELDNSVQDHLEDELEKHKKLCGQGTKKSCKKAEHYKKQLAKFKKFRTYHDTFAIGQDEDGNTVIISISNKKGNLMLDPQNNTTPAQRLAFIRKQFGPDISETVADTIDTGIDEVSRAKESTITSQSNMEITEELVRVYESDKFKKYRNALNDQATGRGKPTKDNPKGKKRLFGLWLEKKLKDKSWEELSTKKQLELMEQYIDEKLYYTDEDGEKKSRVEHREDGMYYRLDDGTYKKIDSLGRIGLPYDVFGKISIKLGEFGASEETEEIKQREDNVIKKVHSDVTTTLFKEDEPDGYHPDTNPEAHNGENVQAYITGVLKAVHADLYIDMEDDDDYDLLVQMGINGVRASHVRECLAEQSGFKGDTSTKKGKEALKEHLRKRSRIQPGGDRVSVMNEGKEVELFNDQWRTAGAGQQKVATHFGDGMIECMTQKVKR